MKIIKVINNSKNKYGNIDSMRSKYEMLEIEGEPYYRIRALRDIPAYNVKKGDIGGYVESEGNLANYGDGWIEEGSSSTGNAFVQFGYLCGKSELKDDAVLSMGTVKKSIISGNSHIKSDCFILNSSIENGYIESYATIRYCTLENIYLHPSRKSFQFENVTFSSKEMFELDGGQDWSNVFFHVENGSVKWELSLKNSMLNLKSFFVHQNAEIENLTIQSQSLALSIANPYIELEDMQKMTTIKGMNKNDVVNIEGLQIEILSSTLEGHVAILGNVKISDCVIKDYAKVMLDGEMANVTMSELSCVMSYHGHEVQVENIVIGEDTVHEAI